MDCAARWAQKTWLGLRVRSGRGWQSKGLPRRWMGTHKGGRTRYSAILGAFGDEVADAVMNVLASNELDGGRDEVAKWSCAKIARAWEIS